MKKIDDTCERDFIQSSFMLNTIFYDKIVYDHWFTCVPLYCRISRSNKTKNRYSLGGGHTTQGGK